MEGFSRLAFVLVFIFCEFSVMTIECIEMPPEPSKPNCSDSSILLRQGNLSGNVTASKDGPNLRIKIKSKVAWNSSTNPSDCGSKEEKARKGSMLTTTVEKGGKGVKGEKGERGERGERGENGEKGEKGEKGSPGSRGLDGAKGDKGEIGLPGNIGLTGPKGDKGDIGQQGPKGENGKDCEGLSAAESGLNNVGSKSMPAYTCSSIPDDGSFYVNPSRSFEVNCEGYKTCIKLPDRLRISNFNTSAYEFKDKKGFWLSTLGFTVKKLYDQDFSRLLYLMTKSEGFQLTMKYHCFNSPVESLRIMTWNGNIISNISSSKTPIKFVIPEKSNGCKDAKKNELKSSTIEIESDITSYLPVDFYLGDIIGDTIQKVYIELTSLCFK